MKGTPRQILVKDSTGATFNRGDFTNGNAFFWSSLDLSPYTQGPYLIELIDAAAKKATGYIGAVGAGETLGDELVLNPGMEAGNPPTNWNAVGVPDTFERSGVQKHSGDYSAHVIELHDVYVGFKSDNFSTVTGRLYEISGEYYLVSGLIFCGFFGGDGTSRYIPLCSTTASWQHLETIFNEPAGGAGAFVQFYSAGTASEFYGDDVSWKQVTEPPATAVQIVSSLYGATRDWTSIEGGFDPNTIASWQIWFLQTKKKYTGGVIKENL